VNSRTAIGALAGGILICLFLHVSRSDSSVSEGTYNTTKPAPNLDSNFTAPGQRTIGPDKNSESPLNAKTSGAKAGAHEHLPNLRLANTRSDDVRRRYQDAQLLVRKGESRHALTELLRCFDEGRDIPDFSAIRRSFVLGAIRSLGEHLPEATAALVERRASAEKEVINGIGGQNAIRDWAALNRALKEEARMLTVFDRLPIDSRIRTSIAPMLFDPLAEAMRYKEAAEIVPYFKMVSQFNSLIGESTKSAGADVEGLAYLRTQVITQAAKNIEVLAGSGNIVQAKEFIARVLSFDRSPDTAAIVRARVARAGHNELVP
jgi:hypothetical protein